MGYCDFLTGLFEEGRVILPGISPLSEKELSAGDGVLAQYERLSREEMPGVAPRFVESAGRWAGTRLFRACQFAVYRDIGEEAVNQELGTPYRETISPDTHYSVDLVFRYLPDLTKFAGSAAEQDPLLAHLRRWAVEWPLSSVGMPEIGEVDVRGFAEHAGLMLKYVDRVIASKDDSRLSDKRVRAALQGVLGMYADLAPDISARLTELEVEDTNR